MTHARTRQDQFPGGPGGRPNRIYLVEDDPAERTRVAEILERAGYEVVIVPSLAAAVTQGFWGGDLAKLLFVGRHGRDG